MITDKVICYLCNKEFEQIANSHLRIKHKISFNDYKQQFPQATLVGKIVRNKIKSKSLVFKHSKETKEKMSLLAKNRFSLPENNPRYIDGRSLKRTKYPKEFSKELREYITERDKFVCQHCGITEEEHLYKYNRKLTIHHIDYNTFNNYDSNLITMCVVCNSKFNSNRKFWVNYINGYLISSEVYYRKD